MKVKEAKQSYLTAGSFDQCVRSKNAWAKLQLASLGMQDRARSLEKLKAQSAPAVTR
jgi:hypothetical protein